MPGSFFSSLDTSFPERASGCRGATLLWRGGYPERDDPDDTGRFDRGSEWGRRRSGPKL